MRSLGAPRFVQSPLPAVRLCSSQKPHRVLDSGAWAMLSVFSSPGRYTQGRNATAALGQEMVRIGLAGPVLIVAGQSAARLLSEAWAKTFSAVGLAHTVHAFGGECSLAEVDEVVSSARRLKARTIVG